MDNVGIVVDDLGGAIDFFRELGLELRAGDDRRREWAGRVTGLGDQRVEIADDAHAGSATAWLELSRFLTPLAVADHRKAPVNALGYLRVMFAVDDIDETLERLRRRGAQLVGEVVQYKDAYRLCYIRGPGRASRSDSPKNSDERNTKRSEKPPLSATGWIVGNPETGWKRFPFRTRKSTSPTLNLSGHGMAAPIRI